MNSLINLQYKQKKIRTVTQDDVIWFVAKDVCEILDISNPSIALERLDEDERSKFNLGRQGETNIVNEFGLYNLILGSRKPEAKAFKRWVTHEVLPAIRKDGVYCEKKPGMSIEYKKQIFMIEALMDERKHYLEMNREIIKQVRLIEQRLCKVEDHCGIFAYTNGKPTVEIGSTQADECNSLFVEFTFSGKHRSFNAMNTFLQELENFLVANGYHQERKVV